MQCTFVVHAVTKYQRADETKNRDTSPGSSAACREHINDTASTPAKGDLIVKGVPSPGRRTLRGRHCKDLIDLYVIVALQLLRTAGKRALQPLFQRLVELLRRLHLRPVTRLELDNFRTWHEFLHRGFPELRAADVVARRSNEQGRFLYRPRFCSNGCVRGSTIRVNG